VLESKVGGKLESSGAAGKMEQAKAKAAAAKAKAAGE